MMTVCLKLHEPFGSGVTVALQILDLPVMVRIHAPELMKLKSRPDDFQVEEITSVVPQERGELAFYRLEKKSLGTPEAIQKLCRVLRVDPRRVRYGGLKDRHAQTIQYLTIEDGPPRHYRDELLQLRYLGQVTEPYGPQSFTQNRFIITLRDIEQAALEGILQQIAQVQDGLIANYFDDQRFGSVTTDQQFVARALIDGNEELALKLALSSYYEHDRSQERKAKAALREKWGQWQELTRLMPDSHLKLITQRLVHQPSDFRSAFALIPFFLRNMYLSAYQSHLWNRMLAVWLESSLQPTELVNIQQKYQKLPMPGKVEKTQLEEWKSLSIPLPSSRIDVSASHPAAMAIMKVLEQEKLEMRDIKLKHFREPFFSKGDRAAFYVPVDFSHEAGWDKLHKGHRKLVLKFTLPRGSYATLLVKRITTVTPFTAS